MYIILNKRKKDNQYNKYYSKFLIYINSEKIYILKRIIIKENKNKMIIIKKIYIIFNY